MIGVYWYDNSWFWDVNIPAPLNLKALQLFITISLIKFGFIRDKSTFKEGPIFVFGHKWDFIKRPYIWQHCFLRHIRICAQNLSELLWCQCQANKYPLKLNWRSIRQENYLIISYAVLNIEGATDQGSH